MANPKNLKIEKCLKLERKMKISKKVLSKTEKELLSDFYAGQYWPILKKLLDNDELNIMKTAMMSNFDQEFYVQKGQLLHIERLKAELGRIHKDVDQAKKEKKAS